MLIPRCIMRGLWCFLSLGQTHLESAWLDPNTIENKTSSMITGI
ncbi:hypothetical protein [Candidatus Enterovibrio escicola]|uniref:Uncharacterized protein n=1 Tax=Candidatus Enterovibrio escicola TaxID=1927127 RepID=A0A2A5T263_9GAMM|nr:hypothetical protein [Candidatus Enterovibrio escacola]PCS22208.1 hypothetical protein BTN49_2162 [Candidatus Enterovibrio escacola]